MMMRASVQLPYYRRFGKGKPIVLLHGFPESGVLWKEVWPALSEQYMVIVPDLPGSGNSEAGTEKITMEGMADSIAAILKAEGVDRALFAGHSMGGYVALAFAEKYAAQLAGLCMVHSTAYADDEDKKNNRKKAIELIRKGGKAPFIKQMIPALFSPHTQEACPEVIERQVESGMLLAAESMMAYYQAMLERPERTGVLQKAPFPVQWVIGKDDSVIPFTKGLQQCTLANTNFVSVYNMCGHMSMLENSKDLVSDLLDFAGYCWEL